MADDQISLRSDTQHSKKADWSDYDAETQAALVAADKLLAEMSHGFSEEARLQIETIQVAIRAHDADAADEYSRRLHVQEVYQASHELRGQAGTFGFGLLSELCDSLCILLELEKNLDTAGKPAPTVNNGVWEAIVHHANAVTVIVENELQGDGGPKGRELSAEVARLREVLVHASA